ncbi:CBO0543 family protein [Oceanobacillus senegalensis]|uniref:CBO0543 family protein n=1 Tax=Oceanobacillus senegalensis TaxID=1936063 RepID=UPI000A3087E0|nr:CBO0543 family protein [Oceanobacillus senegalensis]
MKEKQVEYLNEIRSMAEELTQFQIEYWKAFSDFGIWQFWVVILMLIAPLIVLFLSIDKGKMLLLGFFGLNYHVWFAYVNAIGISLGLWEYPYQILPFLAGFALDASLIPVCYMLLYQWTLNHKKNIYLYAVLLSAILAFVLKPMMVNLHLFHMFKGINYIHLFLFYVAFFLVSKLITNLFVWLQQKETKVGKH